MDHSQPPAETPAGTPVGAERESLERDRARYQQLRSMLERDYVSIGELSIWLTGVVLVMVGLHLFFNWWNAPGERRDDLAKPHAREQARVWVGRLGKSSYGLAQIPADAPEVAQFMDRRLEGVYGQPVRTYWLSLFAFAEDTPAIPLEGFSATAVAGGKELAALAAPDGLPGEARLQLAALAAPIDLKPAHETRVLLVFPAHDAAELSLIRLRWSGGELELKPTQRALIALQDFRRQPRPSFFESVHADEGK